MFKFQRRRVAFFDQGRVLPNCVPRPHFSHFAIVAILPKHKKAGLPACSSIITTFLCYHVPFTLSKPSPAKFTG
jgi:hypothetical protein